MRIAFVGPFGMSVKRTMAVRAMPLARELAARGHQVRVILPPWDCPQDAGQRWAEEDVEVHNIRLPPRIPLLGHVWIVARILRELLAFRPQAIHCFKPKSYSGLVAWCVWHWNLLGRRKVRLVGDADDWEGTGGWNELERYTAIQERFFAWQEHWGLTHADALTVASRALETIVWSLGVARERVHYLPNGCSGEVLEPDPMEIEALRQEHHLSDHPIVLLYTRFFEFGLPRVLDVIEGVGKAIPETRWLVIGKGLFGEDARFLDMANERRLASAIHYVGWIPVSKLAAYFGLASVALYPFDDTLVNRCKCAVKLIDLLAAGVPVVADAVGQNVEYIEDGVSGLLVRAGDTQGFVRAVVRLLRDEELQSRMRVAARLQLCQRFRWSDLVARAETAYGEE